MTLRLSPTHHIRLARPSLDLDAAQRFYADGLGLRVLHRSAHDEFAALLMLGLPGAAWHLELTQAHHLHVAPTPTAEDLLVLYLDGPVPPDLIRRREAHRGGRVTAPNPSWDRWGVTMRDPDGDRLVLCERTWRSAP